MNPAELITVVIPTSPSPKHPSTHLIDGAIESVRKQIPEVPILLQVDGLREENANRREQYNTYRLRLIDKWVGTPKMDVYMAEGFRHQAELMRETFHLIRTPLLVYLEHDWTFTEDPIDWPGLCEILIHGDVNSVRFMRFEQIHPEHEYLMHGRTEFRGVPVVKTTQFSGNPQIASVAFFKQLIAMFRVGCRTLIEEFIYGPVVTSPWEQYKCCVYNPPGSMRRLIHTDGRGDDPKFAAEF